MEADLKKQADYLEEIKDIREDKLVYIDESGCDENIVKDKAWCLKGKILKAKKSGKYKQRTNIVAGIVNNKVIAPCVFKGSCNTELFNKWIEEFLIKELRTGQIVIMDNASFHKSKKTRELIEQAGCKLIFLPPYSPELNRIEKFWANMKRYIKNHINNFKDLNDVIQYFFRYAKSS